jgi:serine/threonine protein phosphatase 1
MITGLQRLLRDPDAPPVAAVPGGQRVYAVGDIHGRRDLFGAMIAAIDADDAARGPADTTVILLGDLVDRGPDSAGVVEDAMRWGERRRVRLIAGNHEEMFLESLDDPEMLRHFIRIGGRETVLSYGIDALAFKIATLDELRALLCLAMPAAHRRYLEDGEESIRIGDYLFAHAGIMPGIELAEQNRGHLRWIREPFLSSADDHGVVVVHGHTIVGEPAFRHNRIGIDTGAYASGRLTALCLEGEQRRLVEARAFEGTIGTSIRPA